MSYEELVEPDPDLGSPSIYILSALIVVLVSFDVIVMCCLKCRDRERSVANAAPPLSLDEDEDEERGLFSLRTGEGHGEW